MSFTLWCQISSQNLSESLWKPVNGYGLHRGRSGVGSIGWRTPRKFKVDVTSSARGKFAPKTVKVLVFLLLNWYTANGWLLSRVLDHRHSVCYPLSTTQVWALRNSTVLRAFWACLSFIIPIDNIWLQHSNPYFFVNMSTGNGKLEPKHLFRKNMLTDSNLPFYYDEQNEFMADCASSQYNMGVVLSYIMEEGSE